MSRFWTSLPLCLLVAVPVWTARSALVMLLALISAALGALGIASQALAPITAAGVASIVAYAAALWSVRDGVNVIGATVFGLGLLCLLDLSAFAARFYGVDVTAEVTRAQLAFWLGRAAIAAAAVTLLTMGGFIISLVVPGSGRAAVAGAGALLAFAAVLHAGIARTDT